MTATDTFSVDEIIIGKRHRRDIGDVGPLAQSIAAIGLLHPVVIRPDGLLIAGERRLAACRQLGWTDIPVTVVDLDAVVTGEFAENTERKDFTLSESPLSGRSNRSSGPRPKSASGPAKVMTTAADAATRKTLGKVCLRFLGGRSIRSPKLSTRAALLSPRRKPSSMQPKPSFGRFLEQMDDTGRVNGVYRRFKIAKQAELIRAEPPPLPGNGPYRVIVADPPWPYEIRTEDPSHRAVRPYPTMSIPDICAFAR